MDQKGATRERMLGLNPFFCPKNTSSMRWKPRKIGTITLHFISALQCCTVRTSFLKILQIKLMRSIYVILEIYQALLWSIVSISRKISFIGNIAYLHNCVFMLWFPLRFGLLFQGEGKYPKKLNVKTFPISSSNRGASKLHWSKMPSKQKALVCPKTSTKIY